MKKLELAVFICFVVILGCLVYQGFTETSPDKNPVGRYSFDRSSNIFMVFDTTTGNLRVVTTVDNIKIVKDINFMELKSTD